MIYFHFFITVASGQFFSQLSFINLKHLVSFLLSFYWTVYTVYFVTDAKGNKGLFYTERP